MKAAGTYLLRLDNLYPGRTLHSLLVLPHPVGWRKRPARASHVQEVPPLEALSPSLSSQLTGHMVAFVEAEGLESLSLGWLPGILSHPRWFGESAWKKDMRLGIGGEQPAGCAAHLGTCPA